MLNSQLQNQDRSTGGFSIQLIWADRLISLTAQLGSSVIMEGREFWPTTPNADTRYRNGPNMPFILHSHTGAKGV
jgi:hypothetical protein